MAESTGDAPAPQAPAEPSVSAENVPVATAFDLDEPKKLELREQNAELCAKRPKEDDLKKRDSTVKKCSSMTGRLKQVKEDWLDGRFLQELERVNLSKYMSEIATAVGDLKLKNVEVWPTVQIVSRLHCTYAEFAPALVLQFKKVFETTFNEVCPDRKERISRRRSTLRLLYDLALVGVVQDHGVLLAAIRDTLKDESKKEIQDAKDTSFPLTTAFIGFLRMASWQLMGPLAPAMFHAPTRRVLGISPEKEKWLQALFGHFFKGLVDHLVLNHKQLLSIERENHKFLFKVLSLTSKLQVMQSRGELHEDAQARYDEHRKYFDKLKDICTQLGDIIGQQLPELKEDVETTRLKAAEALAVAADAAPENESPFDDEDTRAFYEDFPVLRASVPACMFGDRAAPAVEKTADVDAAAGAVSAAKADVERLNLEDDAGADGDGGLGAGVPTALDNLLARLSKCVSKDLDDSWCIEFCHLNNRGARRRLVRTMFNVSRTSLELLSHYSRITAVLSQELPDIGITLVQQLEEEFAYHLRKKDPHTLEAKVKNIRFIGELTKIQVADVNVALTCLKDCLEDFTQHNIDVACHLLESCGRYLYRRRDAHVRCRHLIETMMRLRSVKHLDPRQDGLVENAYFLCRPPEKSNKQKKQRPVLHDYIRKLLLQDLTRDQLDTVLVRLRRLPWPESEEYVLKTLIGISKGRYQSIPLAASVVAGLSRYYENISIHLVDQLIDEILCGLQHAPVFGQQRSIANVRFIGELYNYEVINSRMVFFVLWSLLYHAHVDGPSDGPDDTFRIRLACTLLETSGEYFSSGVPGKRLEFFMLALTKFALVQNSKRELPLDVEFVISDTFDALRPGFKLPKRVDECERMMAALKAKVNGRVEFDPNMLKVFNSGNAQEVSDEEEEERAGQEKESAVKAAGSSSEEGSGSDEAEEDAVVIGGGEEREDSDDELFDRDFDKMMAESLESRKYDNSRSKRGIASAASLSGSEFTGKRIDGGGAAREVESVLFKLVVRNDKNKPQVRDLAVPVHTNIAKSSLVALEERDIEREKLKQRVLQHHESQKEEEAQHGSEFHIRAAKPKAVGLDAVPTTASSTPSFSIPTSFNSFPAVSAAQSGKGKGKGQ